MNKAGNESATEMDKLGVAIQTAEKQGASQDALHAIAISRQPDLEERLSVEELTRVAHEAGLCSAKNELTYEENSTSRRMKTHFYASYFFVLKPSSAGRIVMKSIC